MPSTQTAAPTGSAERWGPLWGARPIDWAMSEDQQTPTYEAALERIDLKPGQLVLDVGCGVGTFLRLVADRGRVHPLEIFERVNRRRERTSVDVRGHWTLENDAQDVGVVVHGDQSCLALILRQRRRPGLVLEPQPHLPG